MLSLFTRPTPGSREQIAAIDWKPEHYRDNARGQVFATLEEQREEAARVGLTPFYIRPLEGSPLTPAGGPYAVRPVWNAERRTLDLVFFSTRHPIDESTKEAARYSLPPHVYALALAQHRDSILTSLQARFGSATPGGVIRARHVGAESIRDFLREHHLDIAMSFATGLFNAIVRLETERTAN